MVLLSYVNFCNSCN